MTPRDPIAWEQTLPIRPSSPAWRATVRAAYGSPLDADELELFTSLAGREPPDGGSTELAVIAGRRGGKSETAARIAVFECVHGGHSVALAPGQLGVFAIISPLREQSAEILNYARGLAGLPQVKARVANVTRDSIEFRTGTVLKVMTCDSVALAGPTLIGGCRDEWARWPGAESATPDEVIEGTLRPALAPVVGAPPRRLIGISSAYLREGLCYSTDAEHYGVDGAPVLVVRGRSETFNPALDKAWLERERSSIGDRVFRREYLCEWQDSICQGYFSQVLDQCVDRGRELSEPRDRVRYFAAMDPAWRGDSWAMAVCHREKVDGQVLTFVDGCWAWRAGKGKTLSTRDTLKKVRGIARRYGCDRVLTDQAAAPALVETAQDLGLYLVERPWTSSNKPGKYRQFRAAMSDSLVRLPDDHQLISELSNIQSRLLRGGGEAFEAARGRDDRVSAVVLAATEAMDRASGEPIDDTPEPPGRWVRTTSGYVWEDGSDEWGGWDEENDTDRDTSGEILWF